MDRPAEPLARHEQLTLHPCDGSLQCRFAAWLASLSRLSCQFGSSMADIDEIEHFSSYKSMD